MTGHCKTCNHHYLVCGGDDEVGVIHRYEVTQELDLEVVLGILFPVPHETFLTTAYSPSLRILKHLRLQIDK